jgi:transposase
MDALTASHDAAVQMIDTSIVRVHQHGACIANNTGQHIGRSRGGLTSKIHVVVDGNGLPVQLGLTGGQAHDNQLCSVLLRQLPRRARLLADRGYDADWIRAFVNERGAWANISPKRNRLLQPLPLPRPQPGRAVLQQDQAVSSGRRLKIERLTKNHLKQPGSLTTRLEEGTRCEPPTRAPFNS